MGILRPRINVLYEDYKIKILKEAKDILENLGIFLDIIITKFFKFNISLIQ